MKLLAEEQVLQDEALSATEGGTEGGQKEADEFEHRGRIADQAPDEIAVRPLPPTGARSYPSASRYTMLTSAD